MVNNTEERKIITNKVCDFEGDKVTVEDIQKKIDETKKAHKYEWVKFYISGGGPFMFFAPKLCLNVERYETPKEANHEAEKENRRKLFNKLKEEFEPTKRDIEKSEVKDESSNQSEMR